MAEKPHFDSLPAWVTWVDVVGQYGDPECRCRLCVAFGAWIQQSAERTETELLKLKETAAKLEKLRDKISSEEWSEMNHNLMVSTLAAEIKLQTLLQGWAKGGES
jgi:hypothetical protein